MERFLTRLLGLFFILTGPLNAFFNIVPLSLNFINMNNVDGVAKPCRDRAEGGAGGALAPPLFCKNKNKLNKK